MSLFGWMYVGNSLGRMAGYGIKAASDAEDRQRALRRERIARGQHPEGLPDKFLRGPKLVVLAGAIVFLIGAVTVIPLCLVGVAMMVVAGEVWSKRKKEADRHYINAQRLERKDLAEGWQ